MTDHRIGLFSVGKRTYAAGLFWQPVRTGKSAKADAQAFAAEHHFAYAAYHFGADQAQAGLIAAGGPKPTGAYALAAALTSVLGDSWIAAFSIDDGRMVMAAAHHGAIVPGSDRVGSREDVQQAFNAISATIHSADGEWSRIIAPAGWAQGAEALSLPSLLAGAKLKSHHKVRQVKFRLSMAHMAGAIGLATLLVGGTVTAKSYLERVRENDRLERLERVKALAEAERKAELDKLIAEGPWSKLPAGGLMLDLCAQGWAQVPLSVEGWLFDSGTCAVNQLMATYRRGGTATVGAFSDAIRPKFGEPIIREAGEVAAIMFRAEMPVADEGDLPPINQQLTAFISHTQAFAVPVELGDLRKGGVDEAAGEDAVASWHAHSFHLTTALPPEQLFADLELKGLRISQIDLRLNNDTSELTWAVSGDLYGK